MIYFASDLHLGDDRLQILFRHTSFNNMEDMNTFIIEKWNNIVTKEDIVICLGDMVVHEDYIPLLSKLNGEKYLIVGNKEQHILENIPIEVFTNIFSIVTDYVIIYKDAIVESELSFPVNIQQEIWNTLMAPYNIDYLIFTHKPVDFLQYKTQILESLYLPIYQQRNVSLNFYLNQQFLIKEQIIFGIVGHIHRFWMVQPDMINVGIDLFDYAPISLDVLQQIFTGIFQHYYDNNVFITDNNKL